MKEKGRKNKNERASQEGSVYYFLALFVLLPLAVNSKFYFDINHVKYFWLRLIAIGGACWFIILSYINSIGGLEKPFQRFWEKWHFLDYLMIIFLGLNVLTCLLSGQIIESFIASADKQMGLQYYLLIGMIYFTIRIIDWSDKQICRKAIIVASIGIICVVIFAMCQFLGMDFGGQLARIGEEQEYNFISTLGNTGVFGKYVCIVGVVLMYFLMTTSSHTFIDRYCRMLLNIATACFGITIIIANADAMFLGAMLACGLFFLVAIKQNNLWGYLKMLIPICVGIICFKILYVIVPDARNIYRFGRMMLKAWPILLMYSLFLAGLVIYRKKKHIEDTLILQIKKNKEIYKILVVISVIVSVMLIGFIIFFSTIDGETDLGGMTNYLRFSDEWGTERGYVWRFVMEIFATGSLKDKLLGFGQGMVPGLLYEHSAEYMIAKLDYYFDNAHSVYLHMLISNGILGTLCYVIIIIKSILLGRKNELLYGCAISLLVVAILDIVCIYEPITGPYIWLLVALCSWSIDSQEYSNDKR